MSDRHHFIVGSRVRMLALNNAALWLLLAVTSIITSAATASFTPYGVTIANLTLGSQVEQAFYDSQGRIVFYDDDSSTVRRVELDGTTVILTTTSSQCYFMTEGPSQELYLALPGDNKIQKLDTALTLTDFVGSGTGGHADGTGTAATVNGPYQIIYFALHNALYFAENGAIRKIIVSTRLVSTVVSDTMYLSSCKALTITHNGTYIYAGELYVTRIEVATGTLEVLLDATASGNNVGNLTTARIGYVWAYELSLNETRLMIGDALHYLIRRLNLCAGYVDNVYTASRPFRGFQQYCYNTTGDCGVVFSGFTARNVQFYAFEDNKTSTNYSCDIPAAGPTSTYQVTPSSIHTSTPSTIDSPSLSLTTNASETQNTSVSRTTTDSLSSR